MSIGGLFKGDKVIWMVFFFLCIISTLEVYSASSSLSYKSGNFVAPILRHVGILLIGVCGMICMLKVKCKFFKLATPFILVGALLGLVWVLIAGQAINGASRWISVLGIPFQPSEIAKGAVVLAIAQILSAMQTENGADPKAFRYICGTSIVFAFLIGVENLSTAALLCVTVFCMMIIGRVPMRQIGKLLLVVFVLMVLALSAIMLMGQSIKETGNKPENTLTESTQQKRKDDTHSLANYTDWIVHRVDTWKSRLTKWNDSKDIAPEDVDLDKDAQIAHAHIAIASSNVVGKGPGNSTERDWLSQAFSDFIYAIIIEETGILGAVIVAFLYIVLLFRTGQIASHCENNFPAFLAMGLAIMLLIQALFNMLVAVGIAPVTGQPLPLISRGGTSTVINCLYVGIILSISRTAKKNTEQKETNLDKITAEG